MKVFLLISSFLVLLEAKPTPGVPDLIIKHGETFLDTGLSILKNLFGGTKPQQSLAPLNWVPGDERNAALLVNTANLQTNREDVALEEEEVKFEQDEIKRDDTLIYFEFRIFVLLCVLVGISFIFLVGYIGFLCKHKIVAIEERGVERYHYKREMDEAMGRH